METRHQSWQKWLLGLFLFSVLCGFGKSVIASNIYQAYGHQLEAVTTAHDRLTTELDAKVQQAKKTHPKYTQNLSVQNLIDALDQELIALNQAGRGPDPRPAARATDHARRVLTLVQEQEDAVMATIAQLDTALKTYPTVEATIRQRATATTDRVGQYVKQGYFKRHFADAEVLVAQLADRANTVSRLGQLIDERDNRPDYVKIYEIGTESNAIADQSIELADRAPTLHRSVNSLAGTAGNELGSLRKSFVQAFDAAARIERYSAYRPKGYFRGLESWQQTAATAGSDLGNVQRLNSMDVQNFNEAKALLESVRNKLRQAERYIAAVHSFDRQVRGAVAQLPIRRSEASSAISRAQSHINNWEDENDQDTATETLRAARNDYGTARLQESSDPLAAVIWYTSAENRANQAYDEVDTYEPPPPSSSDDDSGSFFGGSSSSGGDYSGSSGGFGGSSGGYSGSSSSPGSGSHGGPGSGSFGSGD